MQQQKTKHHGREVMDMESYDIYRRGRKRIWTQRYYQHRTYPRMKSGCAHAPQVHPKIPLLYLLLSLLFHNIRAGRSVFIERKIPQKNIISPAKFI
jgi:hypothetical protein